MEEMILIMRKKIQTVDLHNMEVWEAARYLTQVLNELPSDISEVQVIHGYHRGTVLAVWLRKKFRHKKIAKKILTMNNGITILEVKNY